ncbi:DUF1827 family protein [Bacillus thuringiensis]|uniref:DUF1827 family protein n=1 Tax=Bacillus thuringiensis TaxID=1428 RepID=UPI0033398021
MMKLKDITHQEKQEFIDMIKNGQNCTVRIYSLGEFKIIYSYNDSMKHASVSHAHEEVSDDAIQIIITKLLKEKNENVKVFRIATSKVVHMHSTNIKSILLH